MTTFHTIKGLHMIRSLLAIDAHFVLPTGDVFTIPTSGSVASTHPSTEEKLDPLLVAAQPINDDNDPQTIELPVLAYSSSRGVTLPSIGPDDDTPILIPLAVAAAMRENGLRYRGAVYSPQMLIVCEKAPGRRAAPGLIHHRDLTATGVSHDD